MTVLPISKSTLVYGSSDGGQTFVSNSKVGFQILQQIGIQLNLKSHSFKGNPVPCCVDCELHLGEDGRYCKQFTTTNQNE